MKSNILIASCLLSLVLVACHSKNQDKTDDAQATQTEQQGNPYISDTQAQDTPVKEENLSGEVVVLTASDFVDRITEINNENGFRYKGTTPCIVDFYADWCGPCRRIQPMMERMAQKYKGQLIIYKINVDRAGDICERFGIQSIPTLMFFRRDEAPGRMVGAPSERELESTITDFLNK